MRNNRVNRRTVVGGAAALAGAGVAPRRTMGQGPGAVRPAPSLPARAEFVMRGANVLTMDAQVARDAADSAAALCSRANWP